jgi:hypothetical protein
MEQEEIVELTKPKRSNRKKTNPQPEQQVPVEVITPPTTAVKRTRKTKADSVPAPVEQPQEQPEEIVQTNIEDDPDYKLFLQYAEELAKPAMPTKPKHKPKKTTAVQPAPPPAPVVVKAKPQKKQVAPPPAETEGDIYGEIEMLKTQIADTKVKKTKSQNDFLREQLSFLQKELAELREINAPTTPTTSKQPKQRTVKLPKERIEIIAKGAPEIPKQLPLRDIINSFGF